MYLAICKGPHLVQLTVQLQWVVYAANGMVTL